MDGFHKIPYSGHPGYQNMVTSMKRTYFWLGIMNDIAEYLSKCMEWKNVKVECSHLAKLLQQILILEWKWDFISMDFITGFPRTVRQHDVIMVIMDKLRKLDHLIVVKSTHKAIYIARIS